MSTRTRKSPETRRHEITQAALHLISERGYNGITLKDVADMVGMSQPGILHYVGSKEGLLSLLITDNYDRFGTPEEFMRSGKPGSNPQAPHLPAYFDYLVDHNARQPELTQLFIILKTEAVAEDHPLHTYFNDREINVWKHYSLFPWALPEGMDWDRDMQPYFRMSMEVMDGIQVRMLRNPPIDYMEEWRRFSNLIFPSPRWDSCR